MKIQISPRKENYRTEWPWFAWFPVTCKEEPGGPNEKHVLVWLETVWRAPWAEHKWYKPCYRYRLPPVEDTQEETILP